MRQSFLFFLALLLIGCTVSEGSGDERQEASLDSLAAGWNRIAPGGETICSQGTPYAFYVRSADPEKLLVHFQGGGACWFGEICDLTMKPAYDPFVNEEDDPTARQGIFTLDNPENPFADYSMVYVPYCTADVHLGDRETTYDVPATDSTEAHQVTIRHRGYANAQSALAWAYAHFDNPETIFVTGSSAGAIASPFYAGLLADHYPDARIVQLGDAAGGYRSNLGADVLPKWGILGILPEYPAYEGITADSLTFETFYVATAQQHPQVRLAQYNAAYDDVQRFFLSLSGQEDLDMKALIEANLADIRQGDPDFRAYTAGGDVHTILSRPAFYTYTVGATRFLDWVAALEAGEAVADVACDPCDRPELYAGPQAPDSETSTTAH